MNKVILSGIILDKPQLHTTPTGTMHAAFRLGVRHWTKGGIVKREAYRINCWHDVARWASENLTERQLVCVQGYLTQRQLPGGVSVPEVEIAAEEIMPSIQTARQTSSDEAAAE